MVKNIRIISAFMFAGFLLIGCAPGIVLAPSGVYKAGDASQEVTLDRDWSDATAVFNNQKSKAKLLTIDGILLNRLYISHGLTESEPLFVGQNGDTKTHIAPRPNSNMSLSEQMDYVTRSLGEINFQKIQYKSPKPVTISGQKGIRFELAMRNNEGLDINGLAQAVSKDGKNYYIVYLAPKEYYYNSSLKNAIAVMDSAKLP
jgi:hypothetical protein